MSKVVDIYLATGSNKAWACLVDNDGHVFLKKGMSIYTGIKKQVESLCETLESTWYKDKADIRVYCDNLKFIDAVESRLITKTSINLKQNDDEIWNRLVKSYIKCGSLNMYKADTNNKNYITAINCVNKLIVK